MLIYFVHINLCFRRYILSIKCNPTVFNFSVSFKVVTYVLVKKTKAASFSTDINFLLLALKYLNNI